MTRLRSEHAPAKINLFLRVTGRRPDGYHELDSLFVPISLHDRLRLRWTEAADAAVTLECASAAVPPGPRNLAVKAARAFMAEFGVSAHVVIELHKEIPAGSGLGGGSSDAAAVLRALKALSGVAEGGRLFRLALALGADVPFFLVPAPARVGGIGERIEAVELPKRLDLVIAVPPFEVSTAAIFGALKPEDWSGAAAEDEVSTFARGGAVQKRFLVNDLASVAATRHPEIARLRELLEELGARGAAMTGSGGGVFGIFDSAAEAQRAAAGARARESRARIFTASSINRLAELDRD